MWPIIVGIALLLIIIAVVVLAKVGKGRDEQLALGDEKALSLRRELDHGEWKLTKRWLERSRTNQDERGFLLTALSREAALDTLDAWVSSEPESPEAVLLRGKARLDWAWEARSAAVAEDVSEAAFETFFERLELARRDLESAAQRLPDDAAPHAELLIAARGLQWDGADTREMFARAIERDPLNFRAHEQLLTACCEKWGGSHDEMFSVAREASEKAPEGHPLHMLVVQAHIERWLYFEMADDPGGAAAYLQQPDVDEATRRAYGQSLGSPRSGKSKSNIFARHIAAYWFWLKRDQTRLARELRAIGNAIDEAYWGYGTLELRAARKFAA